MSVLLDQLKDFFGKHAEGELAMQGELKGHPQYQKSEDPTKKGCYATDSKGQPIVVGYSPSSFEVWADPLGIKAVSVGSYGGEDEGYTYYHIWKFTNETEEVFLKFNGYYQSYDGAYYQDFRVVQPKEVTRIEYV
jgi:hypothetical protein